MGTTFFFMDMPLHIATPFFLFYHNILYYSYYIPPVMEKSIKNKQGLSLALVFAY